MKSIHLILMLLFTASTDAFVMPFLPNNHRPAASHLFAADETAEGKAVKQVTGEELERMMADWDTPLVVDAYATWCGPCVLMAPEFEAAAKQLEGKVRFVKMDTDKEEAMAARLNIMGLPTLLFLDEFKPQEGDDSPPTAKAVLKGRLEGAIRKERILELCEQYFFDAPTPL